MSRGIGAYCWERSIVTSEFTPRLATAAHAPDVDARDPDVGSGYEQPRLLEHHVHAVALRGERHAPAELGPDEDHEPNAGQREPDCRQYRCALGCLRDHQLQWKFVPSTRSRIGPEGRSFSDWQLDTNSDRHTGPLASELEMNEAELWANQASQ